MRMLGGWVVGPKDAAAAASTLANSKAATATQGTEAVVAAEGRKDERPNMAPPEGSYKATGWKLRVGCG